MDMCNKEDNCGNGVLQPEKFSPRIALQSSQTVLTNPVVVGFYIGQHVHVHCTDFSSMESGLTLRMLAPVCGAARLLCESVPSLPSLIKLTSEDTIGECES